MFQPETASKQNGMALTLNLISICGTKINLLSVNWKWLTWASAATLNPLIRLARSTICTMQLKASQLRRKRKGNRGSPWRKHLWAWKKPSRVLLMRSEWLRHIPWSICAILYQNPYVSSRKEKKIPIYAVIYLFKVQFAHQSEIPCPEHKWKHSLAASTHQEFFCHEQKFLGPSRWWKQEHVEAFLLRVDRAIDMGPGAY